MKRDPIVSVAPILILAAGLAHALPIHAQSGKKFKDWVVACETIKIRTGDALEEKNQCFIAQAITHKESNEQLLRVKIGFNPVNQQPFARISINPKLGLALAPGMALKVEDDEPVRFAYRFCGGQGCEGVLELPSELVARLKAGRKASLIFHNGQQAIALPVSLIGFTAGLRSLE